LLESNDLRLLVHYSESMSVAILAFKEQPVTGLAQQLGNSQISAAIATTEHRVKDYLRAIFEKTGMRLELALWYVLTEWV
jgi:DNA-binding NarL/FixJ family response regulator